MMVWQELIGSYLVRFLEKPKTEPQSVSGRNLPGRFLPYEYKNNSGYSNPTTLIKWKPDRTIHPGLFWFIQILRRQPYWRSQRPRMDEPSSRRRGHCLPVSRKPSAWPDIHGYGFVIAICRCSKTRRTFLAPRIRNHLSNGCGSHRWEREHHNRSHQSESRRHITWQSQESILTYSIESLIWHNYGKTTSLLEESTETFVSPTWSNTTFCSEREAPTKTTLSWSDSPTTSQSTRCSDLRSSSTFYKSTAYSEVFKQDFEMINIIISRWSSCTQHSQMNPRQIPHSMNTNKQFYFLLTRVAESQSRPS